MSSLHHHWATTNDDEGDQTPQESPVKVEEVTVHKAEEKATTHVPVAPATVSRRPAALVGILMAMAMGSAYFIQDVPGFLGQVLNQSVIRITETGFDPVEVSVTAGTTLEWVNDQDIPHILSSDELCSSVEGCMETQAIFPGEKGTFTVPADASSGIYEYGSLSDGSMYGKIYVVGEDLVLSTDTNLASTTDIQGAPVVQQAAEPEPVVTEPTVLATEESDLFAESAPEQPVVTEPTPQAASVLTVEGEDITDTTSIGQLPNLPRNPYALGSDRVHPFNAQGQPLENVIAQQPVQTEEFHGGAPTYPRPFAQPSTGSGGLWTMLLASLGILFVVTRKMLKANHS